MEQIANVGKALEIEVNGEKYNRVPVRTHIITGSDSVADVLTKYAKPLLQDGDVVFMSEKAVACTQKRAVKMSDIHPRPLAKLLCRFVYKTPYGIGLGIPETMEMALRECGTLRILFAGLVSVIGKLFGQRGWFYNIAGDKARAIDGPCDYTIPPYNEYVVLGPLDPDETAKQAAEKSGCPSFCIVDLNDLGGNILGTTDGLDREWLLKVLKDNPLGQSDEQTPLGIIRKASAQAGCVESTQTKEDAVMPRAWFDKHLDNMVSDLRRIVKIRSVSEKNSDVKPYGQPCRDVLDEMLKICAEHGIETENFDYYCGSAFLPGETDTEIGLWAHLDVVPDAGEWIYPAFDGEIHDGFMVGRGVIDDKSAAIGGLYLMLYIRENKIPLKCGIRLFLGCDEETGMSDLLYYKERGKIPDYNIIADSDFPVCYGEKGIFGANLVSPELSGDVLELKGGLVSNMVADKAMIKLKKTDELIEKAKGIEGVTILPDAVEIAATGRASHAAHPEGSLNAIHVLAKTLIDNDLISAEDKKAFSFISDVCADYTGKPLGIAASHEEFGPLTCVGGILSHKDGKAVLNINIRYPFSEKGEVITTVIKSRCLEHGFDLSDVTDSAPSYVSREGGFVTALTESFAEITGENLPAFIMGGGTYARHLPNAVAFGHSFPEGMSKKMDLPSGHGEVHEPDEALNLDEFLRGLEIYVRSIEKIDKLV